MPDKKKGEECAGEPQITVVITVCEGELYFSVLQTALVNNDKSSGRAVYVFIIIVIIIISIFDGRQRPVVSGSLKFRKI